jgi:phenylacetate-CoA ligase
VVDAEGHEVPEGECGELVLTTLNRVACPLIRYRSGDWVQKQRINGRLCLENGVLGRVDEMVVIRGVNIYPSAIERVVREFEGIAEFQIEQKKVDAMDELDLLVELAPSSASNLVRQLETRLRDTFSMRIPVRVVSELPRYEFKARRWAKVQPAGH